MASFAGVSFEERGDNGTMYPIWGIEADATAEHIPGGNLTSIDYTGNNQDTLVLNIRCTKAQYDSLRGKVGTVGSLVYSYETHSAFLKAIQNPTQLVTSGVYFASLLFWRT